MADTEPQSTSPATGARPPRGGAAGARVRVRLSLASIVTVCCVALTFVAAFSHLQFLEASDERRLKMLSQRLDAEITRRLESHQHALSAVLSGFVGSERVTRGEFTDLVRVLEVERSFPGIQAIEVIRPVRRLDIDRFTNVVRAEGAPDFRVVTSGDSPWMMVRDYIEPKGPDKPVVGEDVATDPMYLTTVEEATRRNVSVLSDPLRLTKSAGGESGLVFVMPLRDAAAHHYPITPPSATEDPLNFAGIRGWLCLRLDIAAVLSEISRVVDQELTFRITSLASNGDERVVYDGFISEEAPGSVHSLVTSKNLGGRTWRLETAPTTMFAREDRRSVWMIVAGGGLMSVMLGLLLRRQDDILHRSRRLAETLTADLRRLAIVAQRTTNAVVITDAERRVVWVNDGFTRLTGYSAEEAMGKVPGSLLQYERSNPDAVQRMREHLLRGESFRGEILNRSKTGREYWLDLDIQPLRDEDGRLTGFMAIETDITELKKQQELLRKVTDRLEAAIAGTSDGLWDWTIGTDTVWRSRQFWTLLGFGPDDTLPPDTYASWSERLHPDDLEVTIAKLDRAVAKGEVFDTEYRLRNRSGEYRWFRARAVTQRDADGKPARIAGSIQDIDDRKRAEEERDRFFNLSLDPLCVAGFDGYFKQLNSAWSRMLEWTSEELLARPFLELVHPDDRQKTLDASARLTLGEPAIGFENRYACKNGEYRWLSWNSFPLLEAKMVFAVARDVTEQKRLVAELSRSAEMLGAANEAMEEAQAVGRLGSWSYHLVSGRIQWSKQLYRLFDRDEALGPPDFAAVLESYAPESAAELEKAVTKAATEGVPYRLILKTSRPESGVRFIRGEGRARRDGSGRIAELFGTAMDVTAEVEREEALQVARRAAEAASRSKSEFLANMSHEIRTPMTAILGFADLLEEEGDITKAPPTRVEYIRTIKRNGMHLLAVINDILDISKIEAGKLDVEHIDVSPMSIIEEVVSLMQVKAQAKGLSLTVRRDGKVPAVIRSDPVRLRQILVNLVGNAVKFTELGGVTIGMTFEPAADGEPAPGHRLRFDICDTGIGLTAEQIDTLFQPFHQADTSTTRRFGGTGLGLLISRRLAERLGGDISVESRTGQGSTFVLRISTGMAGVPELIDLARPDRAGTAGQPPAEAPRRLPPPTVAGPTDASASEDARPTPPATARPLEGVRILFAEDGPDNQRLISFHFRKAGAKVRVVENGQLMVQALTEDGSVDGLLAQPGPFDLIVSDMSMPEMDGYTAVKLLRSKGCGLPILALTAHAMRGDIDRCLAAGCDAYAAKPVDAAALIELCQTTLASARQPVPTP